jgi:hypothetical protein
MLRPKVKEIITALIVIVGLASTAAAGPQVPKELRGEWCPEVVGSHCSDIAVITPTQVRWLGGSEEGGCDVKSIHARAKAWHLNLICYGEEGIGERTKWVLSISGTRLLINGSSFVRHLPISTSVYADYWNLSCKAHGRGVAHPLLINERNKTLSWLKKTYSIVPNPRLENSHDGNECGKFGFNAKGNGTPFTLCFTTKDAEFTFNNVDWICDVH